MAGNLYLVGFMASGKTTIGRLLARRLGRPFLDTDADIRRAEGRAPARIFAEDGEEEFRRLEKNTIARVCALRGRVVALGGGALTIPGVKTRLKRSGKVIYLQAPLALLLRRGSGTAAQRPLWAGGRDALAPLWRARRPGYRAAADVTVRVDDAPVRIVARIVARLGL